MAGGGLIHAAAEVHHQCRVTEPDYDHPDPQHRQELPNEALFVGVASEERSTETELHCECYGKKQVHDREAADQIKIVSETLVCGLGDEAEKTAHHVTRTMMPRTWSTLPSLGKNSNSLGQKVPPQITTSAPAFTEESDGQMPSVEMKIKKKKLACAIHTSKHLRPPKPYSLNPTPNHCAALHALKALKAPREEI